MRKRKLKRSDTAKEKNGFSFTCEYRGRRGSRKNMWSPLREKTGGRGTHFWEKKANLEPHKVRDEL